MARPRYPSDERRKKQRPHVKIHLSCRSHPRYGHVFEDPEARAIVWGLWLLGVQYHAADTGNEVTLGKGDLQWLTGRERFGNGLARLRRHAGAMGYTVRCEGSRVHVGIRNLQRKQGFDSALRGGATHDYAPSEEQKNKGTELRSAHAGVKNPSRGNKPSAETEPERLRDLLFKRTLRELKAEQDRDYSVAEIEERMERAAG